MRLSDVFENKVLQAAFVSAWLKQGFYMADIIEADCPECAPWLNTELKNASKHIQADSVKELAKIWYTKRLPDIVYHVLSAIDNHCDKVEFLAMATPSEYVIQATGFLVEDSRVLRELKQNVLELCPDYKAVLTNVDMTNDELNKCLDYVFSLWVK